MKREKIKTEDGAVVERLTPETDADLAEIARLRAAGKLDDSASFGDVRGAEFARQPRTGFARGDWGNG